jgi:Flp pilus assembly protein TadD
MKSVFWSVAFAVVCSVNAWAQSADAQFVRIYNLILEADRLSASEQSASALERYTQAETELKSLQASNPTWNERAVKFRLLYLAERRSSLAAKGAAVPPPSAITPVPARARPAESFVDRDREIRTLEEQIRQLTTDKGMLEARLREALSAQPAAVDPREMVRTQDRLRVLQKENELLRLNLQEQKSVVTREPAPPAPSTRENELIIQLKEQSTQIAALKEERQSLQKQLQTIKNNAPALKDENEILKKQYARLQDELKKKNTVPAGLEEARRALSEANRKVEQQNAALNNLEREKDALESRLSELKDSAAKQKQQSEAVARLIRDNEELSARLKKAESKPDKSSAEVARLEKEVAELKKATRTKADPAGAAALKVELASAKSANETLRRENQALEKRIKDLTAARDKEVGREQKLDAEKIKRLEDERETLLKKLEEANQKAARTAAANPSGNAKPASNRRADRQMNEQLARVEARLQTLEAQRVPYTAEELALFQAPTPASDRPGTNAVAAPTPTKKSKALPTGAGPLIAEAQRAFAARRFDEAEKKYQQVLRLDDQNAFTLANLAAIQIEQNRLPEAETHLRRALQQAPDDAYSLSLMGIIKFNQKKYDEAFDALSQSARLDPQNAETQNYLGITLSERGLRGPAETALRKAIQLSPNYGGAHYNLAVIYATQKPPYLELARLHYQKAMRGGHSANPELERILNAAK